MAETEQTWESNPARVSVERLASAMNLHGLRLGTPGGGAPELTDQELGAMLSGSHDRMGELMVLARYAEYHSLIPQIAKMLDTWGLELWVRKRIPHEFSCPLHFKIAELAVNELVHFTRLNRHQRAAAVGIGKDRWSKLQYHFADLCSRLVNAERNALYQLDKNLRLSRNRTGDPLASD